VSGEVAAVYHSGVCVVYMRVGVLSSFGCLYYKLDSKSNILIKRSSSGRRLLIV
jgi:hypothetical protein